MKFIKFALTCLITTFIFYLVLIGMPILVGIGTIALLGSTLAHPIMTILGASFLISYLNR